MTENEPDYPEITRRAQILVDLHDELMEEAEQGAMKDAFERWCEAIDDLRAVCPKNY